jgi:segregation and condensation protein A
MITPTEPATSPPTLAGYQLHLPGYEGPLDVLLRLVERSQLAITDVSLVTVLDQFLEYVTSLASAPSSVIAEFASVGTRLTLLKSRSLLPRPPVVDEEDDPDDLTSQLLAYQRLRDAALHLGEIHASGVASFPRPAPIVTGKDHDTSSMRLAAYDPSALWRSIRRRIAHVPRPAVIMEQRPVLTLKDVIARAISLLAKSPATTFSQLVRPYQDRTQVATAFLATLVLMRRRVVDAEQHVLFGEIELRQASETAIASDDDALLEFEPAS